jgi:hypothetical protein
VEELPGRDRHLGGKLPPARRRPRLWACLLRAPPLYCQDASSLPESCINAYRGNPTEESDDDESDDEESEEEEGEEEEEEEDESMDE